MMVNALVVKCEPRVQLDSQPQNTYVHAQISNGITAWKSRPMFEISAQEILMMGPRATVQTAAGERTVGLQPHLWTWTHQMVWLLLAVGIQTPE